MKKVLGALRRADERFGMISNNDRIAVGLSGGKDSMLLLKALSLYRRFSKKNYTLDAVCIDLGFGNYDTGLMEQYCGELDVPFHHIPTSIGEIVFDIRKEKNPCSLCSKLRKGALYREAQALGCNKAAFGHHMDDVIETFMLNLLFAGRIAAFSPKAFMSRRGITLIRPFILLREWDIKGAVKRQDTPVAKNPCPQDGFTNRQQLKDYLKDLDALYAHATERIAHAIATPATYDLWDDTEQNE